MANSNDRKIFLTAITNYRDANDEEQTRWTRCGVAFRQKSAGGFILNFDTLPLSGRVLMREETEDEAREREQKRSEREQKGRR